MFLYRAVNKFLLSRSYLGKILVVSFLGVHIPIIGAVSYVLIASEGGLSSNLDIVIAMLAATLVGTGATLLAHHSLLAPVRNAAHALDDYLHHGVVPTLPTKYGDEAGVLMANVQESVTRLDAALDALRTEKELETRHFKAKLELLSGMSHELRTPLNHIIGFAEMMSNEVLGPLGGEKYKDYAQSIGRSGVDLIDTVKMLTNIGSAEAESQLEIETVSLGDLIHKGVGVTHMRAEKTGVDLHLGGLDGELMVTVDPRATKQALGHLLHAAVISTPSGGTCLVTGAPAKASDTVEVIVICTKGSWVLDDLPPEFRRDDLEIEAYSEANDADGIFSVSPIAVNLSLVATLARVNGGALRLGLENGLRTMRLTLPAAAQAVAAEGEALAA